MKSMEQAMKIPNIVTEHIVIDEKYSTRLISVTAQKDSIDEINKEFKIYRIKSDLLEAYRESHCLIGQRIETSKIIDLELTIQELEEQLKEVVE